jgi:hypothetical protein
MTRAEAADVSRPAATSREICFGGGESFTASLD